MDEAGKIRGIYAGKQKKMRGIAGKCELGDYAGKCRKVRENADRMIPPIVQIAKGKKIKFKKATIKREHNKLKIRVNARECEIMRGKC